jgi:hypothetical protein
LTLSPLCARAKQAEAFASHIDLTFQFLPHCSKDRLAPVTLLGQQAVVTRVAHKGEFS